VRVSIETGRMTLQHVHILFQIIVFLFAISVHESAHAWMANKRGDPTARMLGRITLNPLKHIDLFGTVLLPLAAVISGMPILGWAKPTPVSPQNFKHKVLDDVLTSVVGPVSNLLVAAVTVVALLLVKFTSLQGRQLVLSLADGSFALEGGSLMVPATLLLYELLEINLVLAVFNMIPLPPLDGSHVVRHFLPGPVLRVYDGIGWAGLLILVYVGSRVLGALINPVLNGFDAILVHIG